MRSNQIWWAWGYVFQSGLHNAFRQHEHMSMKGLGAISTGSSHDCATSGRAVSFATMPMQGALTDQGSDEGGAAQALWVGAAGAGSSDVHPVSKASPEMGRLELFTGGDAAFGELQVKSLTGPSAFPLAYGLATLPAPIPC